MKFSLTTNMTIRLYWYLYKNKVLVKIIKILSLLYFINTFGELKQMSKYQPNATFNPNQHTNKSQRPQKPVKFTKTPKTETD